MRQNLNLYDHLYQSLVRKLQCGVYRHGQALPSQQELCRQYGVGITTVRRVLRMLDRDGYVRAARGQPALVTYEAPEETYRAALAGRRAEIADAYRSLELLMPPLYLEGAKRCTEADLARLEETARSVVPGMERAVLYRKANAFFQAILEPLQNQLALDLELDAEHYLIVPYFPLPQAEDPAALDAGHLRDWLAGAVRRLRREEYPAFSESVTAFYRSAAQRVDGYLAALEAHAPGPSPARDSLRWFHGKEHSELFSHLAMTILRRAAAQEFEDRKYLPSIPELMREYGVTKDTASRAVALLNDLGVARTLDKKGTVLSPGLPPVRLGIDWKDPSVRRRLTHFLEALQIVTLTIRSCAAAFTPAARELAQGAEDRFRALPGDRIDPFFVQFLMTCCIRAAPCHALQNIYSQLNELILWGHYLQAVDPALYPHCGAIAQAMERAAAALREDGCLPDAMERVFALIYENISALLRRLPELSAPPRAEA